MAQLSATIGLLLATLAQTLTVPAVAPQATFQVTPAPARTAPFKGLFTSRSPVPRSPRGAQVRLLPRVVCGMVVVPADPAVDPRMVKPVPSDVTFTMRVIAPPMCLD